MKLVIDKTDIETLKEISLTLIWAFPVVFMVLLPWIFERTPHWGISYWWPLLLSGLLAILYLINPKALYYPCRLWLTIAALIGWFNTRVVLGLAFYGLIFPIGVVLRCLGKLQYQSVKNRQQSSFWIKRQDNNEKQNMKDPF